MDSTYKFTNNSNPSLTYWDLDMAMEDNHNNNNILPHQNIIPSDHLNSFWPNFPSSSSTLFVPDDDHNNNHQLLLEDQRQEDDQNDEPEEELGAMKEMMYKIAAMQPVDIDPATIRKPKRRNVRISEDPQSVAARHRRERISERIRILQRLVPGGTKMDTASMLDEAIKYVKFLKRQIRLLQSNNTTVSLAPSSPDNWAFTIPAKTSSETAPGTAGEGGFATTFGV